MKASSPAVMDMERRPIPVARVQMPVSDHTSPPWCNPLMPCDAGGGGGFEPACSGDHLGLLRAQPAYGSHLGVSTGGRPLGQPGVRCSAVAPRRSPRGEPAPVTPVPRPQAYGTGGYPETRQRARTRRWRLCWSGVLRDIRDHGPLHPDGYPSESKPVHPICSCPPKYTGDRVGGRRRVSAMSLRGVRPERRRRSSGISGATTPRSGSTTTTTTTQSTCSSLAMAFRRSDRAASFAGSPSIRRRAEDRASVMRINRDIRFAKDKRSLQGPLLDLWFWRAGRRRVRMATWFRLTPRTRSSWAVGCDAGQARPPAIPGGRTTPASWDGPRAAVVHQARAARIRHRRQRQARAQRLPPDHPRAALPAATVSHAGREILLAGGGHPRSSPVLRGAVPKVTPLARRLGSPTFGCNGSPPAGRPRVHLALRLALRDRLALLVACASREPARPRPSRSRA